MSLFDIIIIVILFSFVWQGFRSGAVGAIGSIVGVIVGIWAGSFFIPQLAPQIQRWLNTDNLALTRVLAFVLIFILVNIAIAIVVKIVNMVFHIIPFINLFNKIFGALFGLVAGALAVAVFVYIINLFPISTAIVSSVDKSAIADWALRLSAVITPLIPDAVEAMKSVL